MRSRRYDRILAGTALALVLALPLPSFAEDIAAGVQASLTAAASASVEAAPATASDTPAPSDTAAPTGTVPDSIAARAAAPSDPLAALDPADRPIAEKIQDILNSKADKTFTDKKQRAAVETFYRNRNLAPIWLDKGVPNARAKAVIARLRAADTDGLDPNDYKVPEFNAGPDALADAELKLTAALLTYARHVQAGRFPFQRISTANIEVPQQPPDPANVLTRITTEADATAVLESFSPPHEQYRALKAMLAEMRAKAGGTGITIEDGPVLKVQKVAMEDARVPQLRERLAVAGDTSDLRYAAKVAEAVKNFQRSSGLPATGVLDGRTIRELNGPAHDRQIDIVLANMERWRWYPRDMGKAYVIVNIPEYRLRLYKDGAVLWETRIVVGQPSKQTPLLTAEMKYITVNPTWNVPPSIINNEYLPALQQDPTVLDRMGLRVTYGRDGSVHISQPPGDGNALGRVRFNFPNKFLVYQHDTPDKYLFAKEERAYSHGCMRVQDPPKYAEMLLSIANPNEGWTAERIKKMYGHSEQDIHFQTNIPVNLTYQTATVENGKLVLRKDIYGYDSKMIAAIKNERGMIEMAQERKREETSGGGGGGTVRRVRAAQQQEAPRQVNFFEALFGAPRYSAPPVPQRRVERRRITR